MNKEEAERYLEILRAVPDSHGAQVHVQFTDLAEGVQILYWASVMVGNACHGAYRPTPGEAVCVAISDAAKATERIGPKAVAS